MVIKQYLVPANFSIVGYGCGVSRYSQFYYQDLDHYQALLRPYLGTFEGYTGKEFIKEKWLLDLEVQAETFFWGCIENITTDKC